MELSPQIDLKADAASSWSTDKDMLMASITDLSAAFNDDSDEDKQKKDPLDYLMSSLRSFVDGEDFPEDLLDDLQGSIMDCDLDEEIDFSCSVKDLLISVNDLLRSKTTFTLNEGTSLETEMMRLKRFSRGTAQKEKWKSSFDPSGLDDKKPKEVSTEDQVQKQKQKLANVLKDALGDTEEDFSKAPKIRKPRKIKPLNPNRFESASKYDLAPVSPTKRNRNTFRSPLGTNSAPLAPLDAALLSPLDNDPKSQVRRWDSESASPVKRSDCAPRSPMKRPKSPSKGRRLPAAPDLDDSGSRLQLPGAPDLDDFNSSDVPTHWEHDVSPKKPVRILSVRHLVN
jgi:hypothetical protein